MYLAEKKSMEKEKQSLAEVFAPADEKGEKAPIKQPNPLQAYFRRPSIYIKLPTGGRYNTVEEIEVPPNGEIPVYPMTAKDEILMRTPDALMNGATTVDVIQSCVPAIKNAWKLTSLDVDLVLVSIRIASYGETTDVKGVCPKCTEETTFELDLRTITDRVSSIKFQEDLTIGDLQIKFAPLTYDTATKGALKNFEQQRMVQSISNTDDPNTSAEERLEKFQSAFLRLTMYNVGILADTIKSVTTPTDVVTDRNMISEFVANADHKTFNAIKDHLGNENQQTTKPPIKYKCDGFTDLEGKKTACDGEWEQPFTIDNSTFFA